MACVETVRVFLLEQHKAMVLNMTEAKAPRRNIFADEMRRLLGQGWDFNDALDFLNMVTHQQLERGVRQENRRITRGPAEVGTGAGPHFQKGLSR